MYCLSPDCHSCNPPQELCYCDEHDTYFDEEDFCEECHAQGEDE